MRTVTRLSLCVASALVSVAGLAHAEDPEVRAQVEEAPVRNYFNLRLGANSVNQNPEMCLDVSMLEWLSAEACGTGSEILHHAPQPEISHWRVKYGLTSWKTEIGWIQPRVGLGFAELQVDRDGPGFQFGGVGPFGLETAGPEATLGLRSLYPLGAGIELVGELNLTTAWFHYAPLLVRPMSRFQPTASLTFGVGF